MKANSLARVKRPKKDAGDFKKTSRELPTEDQKVKKRNEKKAERKKRRRG